MATVLVTGGAGFIGSHIVDLLVSSGFKVVVVDNLSTGKQENVHPRAAFRCVDICSRELAKVFEEFKIDWVCHQAAQIDVRKSVTDPQFDASVNIGGLLNVLENSLRKGVKGVVFASSGGAIYGEPVSLPAGETADKGPLSPYGVSKLTSENYLYYYHRTCGLEYIALRYANVYGPRQDTNGEAGVIAIFTGKMLDGGTPSIFGDGEQTRDFVFVEDVARANLLALRKLEFVQGGPQASSIDDRAFNIATGKATSVNELFAGLKSITGYRGQARYEAERKGEVRQIYLDNHKAETHLSWKPLVNITDGLKITADYWVREKQKRP